MALNSVGGRASASRSPSLLDLERSEAQAGRRSFERDLVTLGPKDLFLELARLGGPSEARAAADAEFDRIRGGKELLQSGSRGLMQLVDEENAAALLRRRGFSLLKSVKLYATAASLPRRFNRVPQAELNRRWNRVCSEARALLRGPNKGAAFVFVRRGNAITRVFTNSWGRPFLRAFSEIQRRNLKALAVAGARQRSRVGVGRLAA